MHSVPVLISIYIVREISTVYTHTLVGHINDHCIRIRPFCKIWSKTSQMLTSYTMYMYILYNIQCAYWAKLTAIHCFWAGKTILKKKKNIKIPNIINIGVDTKIQGTVTGKKILIKILYIYRKYLWHKN